MGPAELRVGDAERDETVSALHEHFAQGRLSHEELDERLTAALRARTVGDLRKVTSDLPEPPDVRRAPHWPHARPGWFGPPMGRAPHWHGPPMGRAPHWAGPPMMGRRHRHRPFGLFLLPMVAVAIFTGMWVLVPLAGLALVFLAVRRAHARW